MKRKQSTINYIIKIYSRLGKAFDILEEIQNNKILHNLLLDNDEANEFSDFSDRAGNIKLEIGRLAAELVDKRNELEWDDRMRTVLDKKIKKESE